MVKQRGSYLFSEHCLMQQCTQTMMKEPVDMTVQLSYVLCCEHV